MKLISYFEKGLQRVVDGFYAVWPQPFPGRDRLQACKIVSHRGEHDNQTIHENTLEAFDLACERGLWGIECDVRWTRDLHPVVIHDPDLRRVFGLNIAIADVTREELKVRCPAVPSLGEVIRKYGGRLHLMIEIKAETYPDPERQNQILGDCFCELTRRTDYHLMSLDPQMLELITFVPASTLIPISLLNMSAISRLALEKEYGGAAGHYFLLTDAMLAAHRQKGQKVGTGYPGSKNCLFREINRGVEWIFSNKAGKLQAIVNRLTEG